MKTVIVLLVVALVALSSGQKMYDAIFIRTDEGRMEYVPGPVEMDDMNDDDDTKIRGDYSGCSRCYDYFCYGERCDYDCRKCKGCYYDCKPKTPKPAPCNCNCDCKFNTKCPDCKLTCGNNTVTTNNGNSNRCQIDRQAISQCATGQGSVHNIVSFNRQSPSGATVVPSIDVPRRELIHLIYNATFCTGRSASNPATLHLFNGGRSPIISKTVACPSDGVTLDCCIDLCEVDVFQGVDLIQQGSSATLTMTVTGGTITGTITAGTCL